MAEEPKEYVVTIHVTKGIGLMRWLAKCAAVLVLTLAVLLAASFVLAWLKGIYP